MAKEIKSLYRKYRPKQFVEVVGQEHITKTLINQISGGKISHAYLFCGTRGTGKTSVAKIFGKAVNCKNFSGGTICGKCEYCKNEIENSLDVFELDAASNNGVDAVRELIEKVKYPPVYGKYKVYIIDEVHMFSNSAFNAFLKTLEEPPGHVIFILATTESHKLPPTVLSRCLRFDFKSASAKEITSVLEKVFKKENIKATDEAVELIAEAGNGSFRDALSIAETVCGYSDGVLNAETVNEVLGAVDKKILQSLIDAILNKDAKKIIGITDKIFAVGRNVNAVIKDILSILKNRYVETGDKKIMQIYKNFSEINQNIKTAADAKSMFEGVCLLCTAE